MISNKVQTRGRKLEEMALYPGSGLDDSFSKNYSFKIKEKFRIFEYLKQNLEYLLENRIDEILELWTSNLEDEFEIE